MEAYDVSYRAQVHGRRSIAFAGSVFVCAMTHPAFAVDDLATPAAQLWNSKSLLDLLPTERGPTGCLERTALMTVARPRLVWVSCWWSNTPLGASKHLCPPILFPLLLNKGELARTFRAPKGVGDDTWQLGPIGMHLPHVEPCRAGGRPILA